MSRRARPGNYSGFAAPETSLDAVNSAKRLEFPPRIMASVSVIIPTHAIEVAQESSVLGKGSFRDLR